MSGGKLAWEIGWACIALFIYQFGGGKINEGTIIIVILVFILQFVYDSSVYLKKIYEHTLQK